MDKISFGSTYVPTYRNKPEKIADLQEFCEANKFDYVSSTTTTNKKKAGVFVPIQRERTAVVVPDHKDSIIEAYLANKGIQYSKLETKDLLSEDRVLSRIARAPEDMKRVLVNPKKFEEFASTQDNNLDHCEEVYNNYYKKDVDLMLKSGDKIPATTLYIQPLAGDIDDILEYTENFGPDRLNTNQVSFTFNQLTDSPDHCSYFGMKEIGMDKIPVYVDEDSYKIGKALELFEEK